MSGRPVGARSGPLVLVAVLLGAILLALLLHGCAPVATSNTPGGAQAARTVVVPPAAADLQQTVVNVIRAVQPSIVEIQSSGGQGGAIGSGEVYRADGYLVTNDHVVRGFSAYTVVLSDGRSLPARVVGEAPSDDLAVVKVDVGGLPPINLADSSQLQVGQFALAIGSPLGLQQSATFGIVSALDRTASEAPQGPAGTLTGLIQTSAPINPGNSGGALVDLQGRLIGIPTLGAATTAGGVEVDGIGFAIPSNRVKFVSDQLVASGRLIETGQGYLGISGADVTLQLAAANNLPVDHGVLIGGFAADAAGVSPAQQAGLRQGDIITALDGRAVAGNGDLAGILLAKSPGTQIEVTVQRGSSQLRVAVTLGQRPAS